MNFYLLTFLLSFFPITAFSQTENFNKDPVSNIDEKALTASLPSYGENKCPLANQPGALYCPEASSIKLNSATGTWSVDQWTSQPNSLSKKITKFIGAQWKGVNIGRINCIYTGDKKDEFPVSLSKNILINNPSSITDNTKTYKEGVNPSKIYIKDKNDKGIYNCIPQQESECECPFYLYEKEKEDPTEIILSIKRSTEFQPWRI